MIFFGFDGESCYSFHAIPWVERFTARERSKISTADFTAAALSIHPSPPCVGDSNLTEVLNLKMWGRSTIYEVRDRRDGSRSHSSCGRRSLGKTLFVYKRRRRDFLYDRTHIVCARSRRRECRSGDIRGILFPRNPGADVLPLALRLRGMFQGFLG